MKRDLGNLGESAFNEWCAAEAFHAQRSQSDRYGWDFLLEREPARTDERPLDGQNAMPKFLVQVKATEGQKDPPRIKLSALKHLVDADLPAAIAVLVFDKDGRRPHRRLLAPVNEKVMYETLSRDDREVKIVGGEPRVIAEVVRPGGADTTDFIDTAVETFRRDTKLDGPALIAGGFTYDQDDP